MSAPEQNLWTPPEIAGIAANEVPLHPNGTTIPGIDSTGTFPFIRDGEPDITRVVQTTQVTSESGRHALVEAADTVETETPANRGWGADAATPDDTVRWFADLENFGDDQPAAGEPETLQETVAAPAVFAGDNTETAFTGAHLASLRALVAADEALHPAGSATSDTEVLTRTALRAYTDLQALHLDPNPVPLSELGGEPPAQTADQGYDWPQTDTPAFEQEPHTAEPEPRTAAAVIETQADEEVAPAVELPHVGALGSIALATEALQASGYDGIVVTNPDQRIHMPAGVERDSRVADFNNRLMPGAWYPDLKDLYGPIGA
ncbi:MAG TPA: hypothetical protein VLG11_00525 [Candidatus Saccharimonadales bacterium]|nr:hypothetical protein [Candidatus Saccharimonadales bacterium]